MTELQPPSSHPGVNFRRCAAHRDAAVDIASCHPCHVHWQAALLEIDPPGCSSHRGEHQVDCPKCLAGLQFVQLSKGMVFTWWLKLLFGGAVIGGILGITLYVLDNTALAYAAGGASNLLLVTWFLSGRVALRRHVAARYRELGEAARP